MEVEEIITTQYNHVKKLFKEKLNEDINFNIDFLTDDKRVVACAIYDTNTISFNKDVFVRDKIFTTIVHEKVHLLAEKYKLYRTHDFVFGIFACLVRRKLFGQEKHFYMPYDFSEDLDFKFLPLNSYEFDKKIEKADISSLEKIVEESKRIAEELKEDIFGEDRYVTNSIIKLITYKIRRIVWKITK